MKELTNLIPDPPLAVTMISSGSFIHVEVVVAEGKC